MPIEQYNPLAGGRGLGRSRLYAAIGKEEAFEAKRYEEELTAAEDAARKDTEGASAWSSVGKMIGLFAGLFSGNPYEGFLAGGEGGKWMHRFASDYDPVDYRISTDMGRFDVQDAYKMEDINRQFEEAYKSQFWQDVAGTGKTLGTMALLGGDSEGAPESAWKRFLKSQDTPAETFSPGSGSGFGA